MCKAIPPATPYAKTNSREKQQSGSTLYISNRHQDSKFLPISLLYNNFEVVGILGKGSFGSTFEVIDKQRGFKHFALKKTQTHLKQSQMEANTLLELDSPCIIAVYGCWQENSALYVQTELGTMSLKELLDNYQRVPEALFWTIAADISNAILESHKKHILHLDIKPSNILLTEVKYFETSQNSLALVTKIPSSNDVRDNFTPDCINYGVLQASGTGIKQDQERLSPFRLQQFVHKLSPSDEPHSPVLINGKSRVMFADDDLNLNESEEDLNQLVFQNRSGSNLRSQETYEDINRRNDSSQVIRPNATVKYVAPLEKLRVSCMDDIAQHCIFQLIDFGQAQHAMKDGTFLGECTCGDSGYVCQQFLQTNRPDYSSDLLSFGLVLLEILTGIELPTSGILFERLRKGDFFDIIPEEFGINLKEHILNGYEIQGGIGVSRECWLAILDLIKPIPQERVKIAEWTEKYKAKLCAENRKEIYDKVIKHRIEYFNISDSQLGNRCVVITKEFLKILRKKKATMHKKIVKKLVKSEIRNENSIKAEIPNIKSFIIKGGRFVKKHNKSALMKQSLCNTVNLMQSSGVVLSQLAQSQPQNLTVYDQPEGMNNLSFQDNQSPFYSNTNCKKGLKYDFENDFLTEPNQLAPDFFLGEEGQKVKNEDMTSVLHQVPSDNSEIEKYPSKINEDEVHSENSAIEHVCSVQQLEILENQNRNPYESNELVRTGQSEMKVINSEITLIQVQNKFTLKEATMEEQTVKEDQDHNVQQEAVLTLSQKEEKDTTSPPSSKIFQSSSSLEMKTQIQQKSKQGVSQMILSIFESLTGLAQMIYYKPWHYYQTPTVKSAILQKSIEQKSETEIDDMTKLKFTNKMKPISGTITCMKLSELEQYGFRTPKSDRIVECLESKRYTFCSKFKISRPLIFFIFCFIYIPIIYLVKFYQTLYLTSPIDLIMSVARIVFILSVTSFFIMLYQLNKFNITKIEDPNYYYFARGQVYIDYDKFKRGFVGFIIPLTLYFTMWLILLSKRGNVGLVFLFFVIMEFFLLIILSRK